MNDNDRNERLNELEYDLKKFYFESVDEQDKDSFLICGMRKDDYEMMIFEHQVDNYIAGIDFLTEQIALNKTHIKDRDEDCNSEDMILKLSNGIRNVLKECEINGFHANKFEKTFALNDVIHEVYGIMDKNWTDFLRKSLDNAISIIR